MTETSTPSTPSSQPDAGAEVQGATTTCNGWILLNSHYVNYNIDVGEDIAVGYTATLHRVDGGSETLVDTITVNYTALKQTTAAAAGDVPATAATNGNPKVILGGSAGYPAGRYKLTLTPEIRHGKLRLRPTRETDNTYAILSHTTGADSGARTDIYVQVPDTTAVQQSWSETFDLPCGAITAPRVVQFAWADFRTWDRYTNARITGSGNMSQPTLEATPECMNLINADMTTALGANWRQVAAANSFFALDPRIRYWTFILINKTEELNERRVRVTNPGRSAAYQSFLFQRRRHCNGPQAVDAWRSNHQYGLAFDTGYGSTMTNAPTDATDVQVLVAVAIGFDWGGSWNSPDRPHFERQGATANTTNYRTQLTGANPTVLTYGGHDYVLNP